LAEPKAGVVPGFGGGNLVSLLAAMDAKPPDGAGDPNMLPLWVPEDIDAKPPLLAKPANPPPDAGEDSFAVANGLAVPSALLANGFTVGVAAVPKLDLPKAGVAAAAEPAAQGDVRIPRPVAEDWPNPTADGAPKAGVPNLGPVDTAPPPKAVDPKAPPPDDVPGD